MKIVTLIIVVLLYTTTLIAERNVTAIKVDNISIDGKLDELCWNTAMYETDFIQKDPFMGKEASQQTYFAVAYNVKMLFIAVKCMEKKMNSIIMSQNKYDSPVYLDDCIEIFIDTYHDHRNCYYFAFNPSGTQLDGRIIDEGRVIDSRWDAKWRCCTALDSNCWYAEIAIPFSEISYKADSLMQWGFNVYRSEKPHQENSSWTFTENNIFQVSKYGHLLGISDIKKNVGLSLLPYVVQVSKQSTENNKEASIYEKPDIGIDLKYKYKSSIIFDCTVNPDFSQIESDQDKFNISYEKGEELYLQEKRPFFLEGLDIFNTPIMLLYTRRMGDIKNGEKVCGKLDGISFAALNVHTSGDDANYYAGRLKGDIFKRSSIGMIYVNKDDSGVVYSKCFGFDANIPIKKYLRVSSQYARSYNNSKIDRNNAGQIEVNFSNRSLSCGFRYTDIGSEFDVAMGYISRYKIDCISGYVWGDYTSWQNKKGIRWVNIGGTYYRGKNHSWFLTRTENNIYAGLLTIDKYYFNAIINETSEKYGKTWYDNKINKINIVTNYNEWAGYRVSFNWGWLYNRVYRADVVSAYIQPIKGTNIEVSVNNQFYNNQKDWILAYKTSISFTKKIYLRTFIQYNTNDKTDQYNVLLGYKYLFGSNIYIVYNEKHDSHILPKVRNKEVMLKVNFNIDI